MRLASASALRNLHRPWRAGLLARSPWRLCSRSPRRCWRRTRRAPNSQSKGASATQDFGRALRCRGRDDRQVLLGQGAAGRRRLGQARGGGAPKRRRRRRASTKPRAASMRCSASSRPPTPRLLTPDEVELLHPDGGLSAASMPQQEFDDRFWGAGVTYAGIGHFSVRIEGRDFVDAVLEGSPAARAGLKVGDEIVSVDGAPYHPIRSFRGKVGQEVAVAVRRSEGGPTETLRIKVMSIAPLHAFREATRASARVIERDGRRIGYVHVWASVGEESEHGPAERAVQPRGQRSGRPRSRATGESPTAARWSDRRHARQDRRHRQQRRALPGSARPARPAARFARQIPAFAPRDRRCAAGPPFSSINIRAAPASCSCMPTSASARVR